MKKTFLSLILAACSLMPLAAQTGEPTISLIPQPASLTQGQGTFTFGRSLRTAVVGFETDSVQQVVARFGASFTRATGIDLKTVKAKKADLVVTRDAQLAAEAYRLEITEKRISISAARPAGVFYAFQTLKQLMPSRAVCADTTDATVTAWTLPVCTIADAPRFGWRGFMLDEGRHIFGKEEMKRVIDVMATYKMNRLHWHLTEDQGWRIEIKKYPRLTSVGAWRESVGLGWKETQPDSVATCYGGFYTQADAREIVDYARDRFIEIVPEVDIPGHSQAAVAAYPEFLACDPDSAHGVWLWQGVSPDVINVASPRAVQFAKDVIDELTEVFPFGYLHLGGDECPTTKWEQNADCQQLLKQLGSTNYRDLQINFYRQLKEHIATLSADRQRRLIFWNEVLHGNMAPLGNDITIMAWVGADAAARDAAQRGLNTILSPQIPYYINRKQSDLPTEPHSQGRGTETVEAVYAYKPVDGVPAELQSRYMGVQANFWTEWVKDASTLEYLMLPRLAAVAEAGWSKAENRDWQSFLRRLQTEKDFYQLKGLNYGKHYFDK